MKNIIFAMLITSIPFSAIAKPDIENLVAQNKQYAICSDVAQANFKTEQEGFDTIGIFTNKIVANLNTILDYSLEEKDPDGGLKRFVKMTSKEITIGYMLKGVLDIDAEYQTLKKELNAKNNYQWRETNKSLWLKHGCNAIYANIK